MWMTFQWIEKKIRINNKIIIIINNKIIIINNTYSNIYFIIKEIGNDLK